MKRAEYDLLHEQARTAMISLGESVIAHRRANKMSIREVAVHLGLDHIKLHHLEHGRMLLDAESMESVIRWLTNA